MIAIGGSDTVVYIYSKTGTQFILTHTLNDFTNSVYAIDVTADGEWLLTVELNGVNK